MIGMYLRYLIGIVAFTVVNGISTYVVPTIKQTAEIAHSPRHEDCLVTFADFAYAVEPDRPELPTELGPEWVHDPIAGQLRDAGYTVRSLYTGYEDDGKHEVWFTGNRIADRSPMIIRYWPEDGIWDIVLQELPDASIVFGSPVLLDGQLWARVFRTRVRSNSETALPVLARFNDETKSFQLVEWAYRRSPLDSGLFDRNSWIFGNGSGVLWLLAFDDGVFRIDPSTQSMMQVPDASASLFLEATRADDAAIYYVHALAPVMDAGGVPSEFVELYRLDIDSLNVERIEGPPTTWMGPTGLMMDDLGRLWYGTTGYRTPDRVWEAVDPLADTRAAASFPPQWIQPTPILKTSDGRFWFLGQQPGQWDVQNSVGTAWLDPATGEGCAFIDQNIPLIEDTNGRLWTVVDGDVYYMNLRP